jgi:hypothetical protein
MLDLCTAGKKCFGGRQNDNEITIKIVIIIIIINQPLASHEGIWEVEVQLQ